MNVLLVKSFGHKPLTHMDELQSRYSHENCQLVWSQSEESRLHARPKNKVTNGELLIST